MQKTIDIQNSDDLAQLHIWCETTWRKLEKDYQGHNIVMFYPCCMAIIRRGAIKCQDHPIKNGEESLFDALRRNKEVPDCEQFEQFIVERLKDRLMNKKKMIMPSLNISHSSYLNITGKNKFESLGKRKVSEMKKQIKGL